MTKRLGWIALSALMAGGGGMPDGSRRTAAAQAMDAALPSLQGDAAIAELERRGEKQALLAAVNVARMSLPEASDSPLTITGPAYLKASNTRVGDYFGGALAVSGDTVVVGTRYSSPGSVHVFVRSGTTWVQQAYLTASNPDLFDHFGYSVAVSGNTVVVGAYGEDGAGTGVNPPANNDAYDAGAAYVFVRNGTTWSQEAYLKASNTAANDAFGAGVAVSGDTIVVGAPGEDGNGLEESGAAYVFARTGATWNQQGYLKASNADDADWFGENVAISGSTIIVGTPYEDGGGIGVNPPSNENAPYAGAAYVFVRNASTWSEEAYLKASDTSVYHFFGSSVAASGDTVVVGSSGVGSGSAIVFVRTGTSWSQQAVLKAFNPDPEADFGGSVSVSGDTVLVGARWEEGGGLGVNPPHDDTTWGAGAAYVFRRVGTSWSQRAYLKASNHGWLSDWFGYAVAISGHTLAVGAPCEDGSGTGVNPEPTATAVCAGAAYLFTTPDALPLTHLNVDTGSDVLVYRSADGHWSRQVGQAASGFLDHGSGLWAPGWSVLPADFNGDDLTDFFLFNPSNGAWAKVLTGSSGFSTQSTGSWWPGWRRYVMDLDEDGFSDVFLYDPASGQWFKCISTPTGFNYSQGGWSPNWDLYPMDFDGDEFDDLFLFNRGTGRWFWALGQTGAGFAYPVSETWYPGWQLYPGDFNGDGLTDLLLHDPPTGTYFVATTGASGFTYVRGGWSLGWTPEVADLDADGRHDVFLHDASTGNWFELMSTGGGGFTDGGGQTWSLGWQLHFTDVDGDGRADILLYDPSNGLWSLARNLVNGSFTYTSGNWGPGLTIIARAPAR
jgi:hypothetical protein